MKIAVPTKEKSRIDNHFGHCEFYTVFIVSDDKKILAETIVESPAGCGCKSNIAAVLADMDVKIMLAGGIGEGAINKLNSHGISVVRNCSGDVYDAVEAYLKGDLEDGGVSCAAHA